jgi:hypothetical protein
MKERVTLFSMRFPQKVISATALYKVYKDHKIRRKQVHFDKILTPYQTIHFDESRQAILNQFNLAR